MRGNHGLIASAEPAKDNQDLEQLPQSSDNASTPRSRRLGKGVIAEKKRQEQHAWNVFEEISSKGVLEAEHKILWGQVKHRISKAQRLWRAVQNRTAHVSVLMEDISTPSANLGQTLRCMDAMGAQHLHVVSKRFAPSVLQSRDCRVVSRGAHQYISCHWHQDIESALAEARDRLPYQIVATVCDEDAVPIEDIDFAKPTLIMFGNESRGLSDSALSLSDVRANIANCGVTESLNVAVSVGIALSHAIAAARRLSPDTLHLTASQQQLLLLAWLKTISPYSRFRTTHAPAPEKS